MNYDDESAALHHQQELEHQQQGWDKPLGAAAIRSNIEYYRAQRIRAHSEYLKAKRSEQYWQRELEQLNSVSSDV